MKTIQKILFISIFKEGDGGGEGRVAYEMARWFSRQYSVVMLCPGETTSLTVDSTGFKRFSVQSVREGNLAVPLLSALNVRKIYQFLDAFKPDVIHIHDPALLCVVGQLWARLNGVPVFYTAHVLPSRILDFGAGEVAQFLSTPANESLVDRYLLDFYESCDAVVGLNATAAAEVRAFGYSGPIHIIPNGRDLRLYNACALPDNRAAVKELAFVGFLNKRKNQAFLLEMMRYLPENYHLTLIGEPLVPAYLEELQQTVAAGRLNVTFTGQLTQAQIAAALEKTHVFVSASKMEVQSLVIIEALASGTPVVGLANETVSELVDDSNGACLPKEASAEAFAQAVMMMSELEPDEYRQLCHNARQRVKDLDWSRVMESTVAAYRQAAEQKQAQHAAPDATLFMKYTALIPDAELRREVEDVLARLTPHPVQRGLGNVKAAWMTWLNMTAAVVGYYVLKGPVTISRRINEERHELLNRPLMRINKKL